MLSCYDNQIAGPLDMLNLDILNVHVDTEVDNTHEHPAAALPSGVSALQHSVTQLDPISWSEFSPSRRVSTWPSHVNELGPWENI